MSLGPVARWLDTFVCNNMSKRYVEVFKKHGYETLNEVTKKKANCNLTQLSRINHFCSLFLTRFGVSRWLVLNLNCFFFTCVMSCQGMSPRVEPAAQNGRDSIRCRESHGERIRAAPNAARHQPQALVFHDARPQFRLESKYDDEQRGRRSSHSPNSGRSCLTSSWSIVSDVKCFDSCCWQEQSQNGTSKLQRTNERKSMSCICLTLILFYVKEDIQSRQSEASASLGSQSSACKSKWVIYFNSTLVLLTSCADSSLLFHYSCATCENKSE